MSAPVQVITLLYFSNVDLEKRKEMLCFVMTPTMFECLLLGAQHVLY